MTPVACPALPCAESLTALVAIIRAAYLAGDRSLELAARRELRARYGMDLSIRRPAGERAAQTEVAHAS